MAEILQLDLGLDSAMRARAWIVGACMTQGFGGIADDAALLISELVTNAVMHAQTGCTILIEFGDESMRAHVIDLDERDVLIRVPGEVAEGGRGLNIVAALATEWGVTTHRTGKSVWFTLDAADGVAPTPAAIQDGHRRRPTKQP